MKKNIPLIIALVMVIVVLYGLSKNKDNNRIASEWENNNTAMENAQNSNVGITPISHATMVLEWNGQVIYTDPVGGVEAFAGRPEPDVILLTDIHGDHLSTTTLESISKNDSIIIAPEAVADLLPENLPGTIVVLQNGDVVSQKGFSIEAVPMYNVPESETAPHTQGRGSGYVVEAVGKRVYISGDTGNTTEMRALKNIDIAFVCMNLPYTMSLEDAAQAVLAFKPQRVIPYHYRGQNGMSDVNKFKELVNAGDSNIQVQLLNFYPAAQ